MKRCVLLVFLLPFAFLSHASAVTTGLNITKTCPSVEPPNTGFQCTFTVQNQDPANTVTGLAVTNTVPFPGGPVSPPNSRNAVGS